MVRSREVDRIERKDFPMNQRVIARAPAKVNLALAVGPARADGMHPIASRMINVTLYDDLDVIELPHGSPSRFGTIWHDDAPRTSDIDWAFDRDLLVAAHRVLENATNQPLPIQATLRKRIPIGGGLGGGSSDAAAMLHALNALFNLNIKMDQLSELGAEIGADVPFLLKGGHAFVEGIGEQISPIECSEDLHLVLIFPATSCSTSEIFTAFDEQPTAPLDFQRARSECFNDLANTVFQAFPALKQDADAIEALAEKPVHLSGSGSTLFLVCDGAIHAEHLAQAITTQLNLPAIAVEHCGGVAIELQ